MGCSKHTVCGIVLSSITVALLVFTYAMPWYYTQTTFNELDCTIRLFYSWELLYCEDTEECEFGGNSFCSLFLGEDKNSMNWREEQDAENREQVYNISAAMLAITAVATGLIFLHFILMVCGIGKSKNVRILFFIFGVIGLVALAVGVIYFALRLPGAIEDDADVPCPEDETQPCNTFMGSNEEALTKNSWGGAGWFVAIFTWSMLLALTINVMAKPN